MIISFRNIPGIIYILALLFFIISFINGIFIIEILLSFGLLIFIFALFYGENEPPVIIVALGFQWLSISIGYLYQLLFNAHPRDLLWRPLYSLSEIDQAFWLSMLGLLAFSLGLKIALFKLKIKPLDEKILENYDTFKIILFYVLFSATAEPLANLIRFSVPGIFQALKTLAIFKWSLFFLMIYVSFKKNEKKIVVFSIIAIEIILGFTGYFSEFKDFIILFPIVYLSFNRIRGRRQILTLALVAVILINIGAAWSYIKVEYREFLSGGERSQLVKVSKQQALQKLWELTNQFNEAKYVIGFEALIKRIYFLEYFSATINHIPKQRPHLDGEVWSKSLQHIFMPRLFFPEKEAIDDSKQTYLLTGIRVADATEGTSISAGYMAESYADYGEYGMHLAIFMMGFVLGLIYYKMASNSLNQLWGFALIFPMFFLLNINGKALIKIFGDTAYFFIVFYFLKRYLVPLIDPHLHKNE